MDRATQYPVSLTAHDVTLLIRLLAVEAFDATMAQAQDDVAAALDLLIRLQLAQIDLAKRRASEAFDGHVSPYTVAAHH